MQVTAKSQRERAPFCTKPHCYIRMYRQEVMQLPVLGVTPKKGEDNEDYDWICPKCGNRLEVRPNKKEALPS